MTRKSQKKDNFEINSLQNLMYYRLQDAYNGESLFYNSLVFLKEKLSDSKAKDFVNEMEISSSKRMKEVEDVLEGVEPNLCEVPCHAVEGMIKETEEMINHSQPSSILDTGILGSLRAFLHYQEGSYANLLSFVSPIVKLSPVKKKIKNNIDSTQREEKHLLKLLEGNFLREGIEHKAYANSPIVS